MPIGSEWPPIGRGPFAPRYGAVWKNDDDSV